MPTTGIVEPRCATFSYSETVPMITPSAPSIAPISAALPAETPAIDSSCSPSTCAIWLRSTIS